MAKRKRETAEGSEKLEHSSIVGGNVKWFDYTGNSVTAPSKLNIIYNTPVAAWGNSF